MAKDPAFLFYSSDFLTGTMFMTNEEVGIYIRLLSAQHQHGGMIDKVAFNSVAGTNINVRSKFIETDEGFYNARLMSEMERRSIKSSNLSANAKRRWENEKQMKNNSNAIANEMNKPSENEDEDENEDESREEKLKKNTKETRCKVSERVSLFPLEIEKLTSKYGENLTQRFIDKLDAYKLATGKTYKSDYGAMNNWVIEAVVGKGNKDNSNLAQNSQRSEALMSEELQKQKQILLEKRQDGNS